MPEIKWIKITTDIFDDEKILLIESMPDADALLVIWLKLLTLAGKKNSGGWVFLTDQLPYTEENLASVMRRPLNTVRLALSVFQKFGMIEVSPEQGIYVVNWEKHQNFEVLEKIRRDTKLRVQRYRERKLLIATNCNKDSEAVTLPSRYVTVQDEDNKIEEEEEDEDNKIEDISSSSDIKNSNLLTIFELYEKNCEAITPELKILIHTACIKFSEEWVIEAIQNTSHKADKKKNWEYIAGTLRNWEKEGHVTGRSPSSNGVGDKFRKGKYGHIFKTGLETGEEG